MNVLMRPEFELANFEATIQRVNHSFSLKMYIVKLN